MHSKWQDQVIVACKRGILGLERGSVSVELVDVVHFWDANDVFGIVWVFDDKFSRRFLSPSSNGKGFGFDSDYNTSMGGVGIRLVSFHWKD